MSTNINSEIINNDEIINNVEKNINIAGYHDHKEKGCECGWEEIHCKCGWVTGWAKKNDDGYEVEVGSADFVKKEFPDGNWYVQCNVCAEKEKAMDK